MNLSGQLHEITNDGFYIFVPSDDPDDLIRREITEFEVRVDDGRTITKKQRNAIFALVGDITEYISAPTANARKRAEKEILRQLELLYVIDKTNSEAVRRQLTLNFCRLSDCDLFSLSDVDMTTANEFITWLIELCIVQGIPCSEEMVKRAEDISRYLYACLINKTCCICGSRRSVLHHADRVGMGRNREKIVHLGMKVMSLCASCHAEAHSMGQRAFDEKYKVYGIEADEKICRARGLKFKEGR